MSSPYAIPFIVLVGVVAMLSIPLWLPFLDPPTDPSDAARGFCAPAQVRSFAGTDGAYVVCADGRLAVLR